MKSMTAYACVSERINSQTVQIIFRSLNYKYLDIFVHNLPMESILLEEKIKKEVRKRIQRGRIEIYILIKEPTGDVYINEKNAVKYILQMNRIAKKYNLKNELNLSQIFNLPQVVYWREKEEAKENFVLPILRQGLTKFIEFKEREGEVIKKHMVANLKILKDNFKRIKEIKPKTRYNSENNKEDIAEEISLISFYINRLDKKINYKKSPLLGKSIDFLTQEILRELNAASSKTKNRTIAAFIVEAKNHLERIREQAQNIE